MLNSYGILSSSLKISIFKKLNRALFFLIACFVIWIVVCLPLALLISWFSDISGSNTMLYSLLCAPVLTGYLWFSIQSANMHWKWPGVQLVGATTILMSVLAVCAPLHWVLPADTVAITAFVLWIIACVMAVYRALTICNTPLLLHSNKVAQAYRLVHLSDLHAGSRSKAFLDRVVTQANSHQPDLIVISGDLVDSSAVDSDFLSPLAQFSAPVWVSIGNHERYVDLQAALNSISAQGLHVLRNESIHHGELQITGIDDHDKPSYVAEQLRHIAVHSKSYNVLLYHRPDGWSAAQQYGFDLTLSGHTHAGQIWPFSILVKRQFPEIAGYYDKAGMHLFVSQGTGTWGPTMRFGTKSEMTVIDIKPG